MTKRSLLAPIATLSVVAATWLTGCNSDGSDPDDNAVHISRVAIVGTESLEAPAVGNERIYTPSRLVLPAGFGPDESIALGQLTVTTTHPEGLKLRLVNDDTGESIALAKVPQPEGEAIGDGVLPGEAVEIALASGGAYWDAGDEFAGDTTRHRIAFAIGESHFQPAATLHVYVTETSVGTPIGGDHVEIARDFFYLTAIGDSAMWGNGLREDDKFTSLIARTIEAETGMRVIRSVHALSGATIIPGPDDHLCAGSCNGEVPTALTSITLQAQSLPAPERIDLILVDGCGNDIGLDVILAPEDMAEQIADDAQRYCLGAMANLLLLVRTRAPQAPIVVTGYFPFVSMDSDVSNIGNWTESRGIDLGDPDDYSVPALAMVANSEAFHAETTAALNEAVQLVSSMNEDDPPIAFADAGFDAENATFAADAWLWGFTNEAGLADLLDSDLEFVPEDPLLDYRLDACLDPDSVHGFLNCVYASAGHPNPEGAKAYARAITQALRDIGVLPASQ